MSEHRWIVTKKDNQGGDLGMCACGMGSYSAVHHSRWEAHIRSKAVTKKETPRSELLRLRTELASQAAKTEAQKKALEFYARHEHWMTLGEQPGSQYKILVANGDTDSVEGWAMAEAALAALES